MLSAQQRRFAYQVVTTGSLQRAAEFVGIDMETAAAWLKNAEVSTAIIEDKSASVATASVTRERLIAELLNMLNVDAGDYFSNGGDASWTLKPLNTLTTAQRKRIKRISQTATGINIEFYDRVPVIDRLLDALNFGKDDAESAEEKAHKIREMLAQIDAVTAVAH